MPWHSRPSLTVFEDRITPAIFTVTSVAAVGPGTLLEATQFANANPGPDTIQIKVGAPGSFVTFDPLVEGLPITEDVTIDGWAQGGPGYEGPPLMLGTNIPTGKYCTVQGIWYPNGGGAYLADDTTVYRGCYFGTNQEGTAVYVDPMFPIRNYTIVVTGGSPTFERCVIAGGGIGIVSIFKGTEEIVPSPKFIGSYMGFDATGTRPLIPRPYGGDNYGFDILGGSNMLIKDNVILGDYAVSIQNSSNNVVIGNKIGTDRFGRQIPGVDITFGVFMFGTASGNVIGGVEPGEGNLIGFYTNGGVVVGDTISDLSIANLVLGNTYRGGTGIAIDLGNDGVTVNGLGRLYGPNRLQNYPVISSATYEATRTRIEATLQSIPNKLFTIQFYAETLFEGEVPDLRVVGTLQVTTDANGFASILYDAEPLPLGTVIRATATDETSEFSPGVRVALRPVIAVGGNPSGPRAIILAPDGSTQLAVTDFGPGFEGGVRVATADVNGDGVADLIAGAGPGSDRVAIFDGKSGSKLVEFSAFGGFAGGVYVAAGDFDLDGKAEVVVTPDRGGGPRVTVYRGADLATGVVTVVADFLGLADREGLADETFRGGIRPAVGDVSGDGVPDLVIAAGFLGGPRVTIWDGVGIAKAASNGNKPTINPLANFFAFEDTLRDGTFAAVGDVTGDGFADLVFGGGPNGGPRVRVVDGKRFLETGGTTGLDSLPAGIEVANFFAGDPNTRGGIRVAVRNQDGDRFADVVTGSGENLASEVRTYFGSRLLAGGEIAADAVLDPFGSILADGVFVG